MKKLFLLILFISACAIPSKTLLDSKHNHKNNFVIDSTITPPTNTAKTKSDKANTFTLNTDNFAEPASGYALLRKNISTHTLSGTKSVKVCKSVKASVINVTTNAENDDMGELVYKIPDTMEIFKEYTIFIRISKKININGIKNSFINPIDTIIKTSSEMEIVLIDNSTDSSFVIKKIGHSTQSVDSISYTEWQFTIKTIKAGDKKLNLIINIIKDNLSKQVVYSKSIHVNDNAKKDIYYFFVTYWQWILASILLPFILLIFDKKFLKSK